MRVTVRDAYDYQLFEIFFQAACAEGGDGIGVVLCEDPYDLGGRFLTWCATGGRSKSWVTKLEKDVDENLVNFHDSNENFIFTSNREVAEGRFVDVVVEVEGPLVTVQGEIIQE